jgi:hypothetical protein
MPARRKTPSAPLAANQPPTDLLLNPSLPPGSMINAAPPTLRPVAGAGAQGVASEIRPRRRRFRCQRRLLDEGDANRICARQWMAIVGVRFRRVLDFRRGCKLQWPGREGSVSGQESRYPGVLDVRSDVTTGGLPPSWSARTGFVRIVRIAM